VVIDVLRASTTIVTALAHGASSVFPRRSVEEARALAAGLPGALLGGERGGVRIDGFDLGNSPLDYTAARVLGRPIVITTTNGTAALAACADAGEVLVGGMINRAAVAAAARRLAIERGCEGVHLVCAGTDGMVTREDILAAGAILEAAAGDDGARDVLDPMARSAREAFGGLLADSAAATAARLAEAFRTCRGGENLIALGMQADLVAAAAIDFLPIVPRLRRPAWDLVPEAA
jgi:2-phosphosulfolactate phosphatase